MVISEMTDATPDVIRAFRRLIPQLTAHQQPPSANALRRMSESDTVVVFIAREPDLAGRIVGSAVLATYETPTGLHAWIEDVVVDQDARRQGVGRALTEACLEKARTMGLKKVSLTSRPSREAANRLYQKMGFRQRKTNLYEYTLE